MVATTREGYLIPTYGPTNISPSAGAEAGMAAVRAVQTQREQTLNSRQSRASVDQQMRRLDEADGVAAAERDRVKTTRDKEEAEFLKFFKGTAPPPFKAGVQPEQFGAVGAGLTYGPAVPAMQPGQFGASAGLSFGPAVPAVQPGAVGAGLSFGSTVPALDATPRVGLSLGSDVPPGAPGGQPLPFGADVSARLPDTPLAVRLAPVWARLEQQNNLPQGYLRRLAEVESSLDPAARNKDSTAEGLFQFLRDTAREYNVQNPSDPMDATQGAVRYTVNSLRVLPKGLGRQPTPGELYLAHQQGAAGAVDLLRNPNQLASAVVGEAAIRLNGGDPATMTAGDFAAIWINKFEGGSSSRRNVPPGSNAAPPPPAGLTEPAAPSITEVDPEATAFQQDIQGLLRQGDIAGALNRIETGLAIGEYGLMGSPVGRMVGYFKDAPDEAARRTQVQQALQWFQDSKNASYMRDNPALIAQAAADPLAFVAAQPRGAPDAAAAETPTAPIQVRTPGGTTIAVSEPDALAAPDAPAAPAAPAAGLTVPPDAGLTVSPAVPPAAAPDAAPAAAPDAAPAAAPDAAPAIAGLPATRGDVAGEILSAPAGAQLPNLRRVTNAGPARMTQEMQALEQQDALLAQLGEYYAATGNRAEAVATRFKRLELRTVHQALQGAQAVARMEMGDFSMAASAVSNATGASVQIQPRADGKFNLLVNGQVFDEGLTYAELKDYVRSTTDSAYRTQQAAIAEAMFKADIEQSGKNADSERKIVEKAAELFQTGQNAEALEKLKQAGLSVQLTDFGIFLFSQDGNNVFTIDPAGKLSPVGVPQPVVGPTSTPVPLR